MSETLSGLDSAFLSVETPGNSLHVMAVMLLDTSTISGGYSFESFHDLMAERLCTIAPLKRRLAEVPLQLGRPRWVECESLDLDYHLRRAALPSPGDMKELTQIVAQINEQPLERELPLWQMTIVEGAADGQIALVAKLHHALMDGAAGVHHMATFFSASPEVPAAPRVHESPDRAEPSLLGLLANAAVERFTAPARAASAGLATAWHILKADSSPASADDQATSVPRTSFNTHITRHRSAATALLSESGVSEVAHRFSATVNDVLLAIVSSALREVLEERDELPDESLIAAVPVSTHEANDDLANAISVIRVPLATHLADPVMRLRAIRESTRVSKQRQRSVWGTTVQQWAEVPAPLVFSLIARAYSALGLGDVISPICNLIVSTVNGPREPLYFCGARLVAIYPFGPVYEGMGLNITALTLGSSIHIGLTACRERVPELAAIAGAMPRALEALRKRVVPPAPPEPVDRSSSGD